MSDIRLFGVVRGGNLFFNNPQRYRDTVRSLEGKEFEMIIRRRHEPATQDQHGYYRASNRWLIENVEAFAGYDEDDIHRLFLYELTRYNKMIIINGKQKEITCVRSTSEMSKKEMADFLQKRDAWLAGHGIVLPDPTELVTGIYKTTRR